jgi:hypothetical protein
MQQQQTSQFYNPTVGNQIQSTSAAASQFLPTQQQQQVYSTNMVQSGFMQSAFGGNQTSTSTIQISVIFATNIVQVEVEKVSNFSDLIDFVSISLLLKKRIGPILFLREFTSGH